MLLLDTITGQFVNKDPRNLETTYAILSHTWDAEGEQTYQELREIQKRYARSGRLAVLKSHDPPSKSDPQPSHHGPQDGSHSPSTILSRIWDDPNLSPKIRGACTVARANGYRYIWIDSCCIDKTSSSELSEAINSMYEWYTYAHICYAFLADVPTIDNHHGTDSRFRRSRWFTRGWTLQELIAPLHVVFLSEDWAVIGSKLGLASLVTDITGISQDALLNLEPLTEFSVAQRFSWASRRKTTRVEDQAYSLLGLFDIHMPTIYGEGERAFRRLQEEIMRRIPDQSLFAWTSFHPDSHNLHLMDLSTSGGQDRSRRFRCETSHPYLIGGTSLLAPSVHMFRNTGKIGAVSHDEVVHRFRHSARLPPAYYSFTSHGIRTQLPLIPLYRYFPSKVVTVDPLSEVTLFQWYLVILACEHEDFPGCLLARICYIPSSESNIELLYVGHVSTSGTVGVSGGQVNLDRLDLLPLPRATLQNHLPGRSFINYKEVYISYPHLRAHAPRDLAIRQPHETICLVLRKKTRKTLYAQGYKACLQGPNPKDHSTFHYLTLSHDTHTIAVKYEHALEDNGKRLLVQVHVKTSGPLPRSAASDDVQFAHRQPEVVDSITVLFTSSAPWPLTHGREEIVLKTPERGARTTLKTRIGLGLDLVTKDHYSIHIDARPAVPVIPFSLRR